MRVAAVDIGSNTVRLLVVDVDSGVISEVDRASQVVGLGKGVDQTGELSLASMAAALTALDGYAERIRSAGAATVRVVATSASRDATNAADFIHQVEAATGLVIEVIPGEVEAALAFAGAVWGLDVPEPRLVIDPGGGSTEFVFGYDTPISAQSIDIGSVRLTDRLLPDRPPLPGAIESAREHVNQLFTAVDLPARPEAAIGVAGTFTSLAAIHLRLDHYDRSAVHGTVVTVGELEQVVSWLERMTLAETATIPSLEPARAPVILAGAVVAAAALDRAGTGSVIVSETDMLEGIVLGLSRT